MRQVLTLLCLGGAVACMFPPRQAAFLWWAAHAQYVSLGYLALGLAFFITDRTRLMWVCIGCSAAISFYYHETGQQLPLGSILLLIGG